GPAGRLAAVHEGAALVDKRRPALLPINPDFGWYSETFNFPLGPPASGDSFVNALAAMRYGTAFPPYIAFSRAPRAISRGAVPAGLANLAPFATQPAPAAVRVAPVWSAAIAAWFGLIPARDAAETIAKLKPQLADLRDASLQIAWSGGV